MTRTIEQILGKKAIKALRRPIEKAGGLPGVAYTGQEFFDLEQEQLFPRTWMGVGFESDIPSPGDAMPMSDASNLKPAEARVRPYRRSLNILSSLQPAYSGAQGEHRHFPVGRGGDDGGKGPVVEACEQRGFAKECGVRHVESPC